MSKSGVRTSSLITSITLWGNAFNIKATKTDILGNKSEIEYKIEAKDYIDKHIKDPEKRAKYERSLEVDKYNNDKGYTNDYYETYESILNDIEDEYFAKEEEYLNKNRDNIENGLVDLAKKGATDEELKNKLNETKLTRSGRYGNLSAEGYIDKIRNKAEGFETPEGYMSLKDKTSTLRGDFKKLGYNSSQISVRGSGAGYSDAIRITIKDPTTVWVTPSKIDSSICSFKFLWECAIFAIACLCNDTIIDLPISCNNAAT